MTGTSESSVEDWDLRLFSPAKINLFLRILGKREDGFHELASLFQAVDLGDSLSFKALDEAAVDDELLCDAPGCPLDKSNLVLRAVELFRSRVGVPIPKFKILLEKNTPIQAGLGGGSSNAATALFGANELCGRPASDAELIEWSGELGSDITFFLGPTGSAYCTGRGEVLAPVAALSGAEALFVVKPAMGLSTPLVFSTLASTEYSTLRTDKDPLDLLEAFSRAGLTPLDEYVNDLEPPAFECEPALADLKRRLLGNDYGFHAAMMSGSGTSLFAVSDGTEGIDLDAFPKRFADEIKRDLDLDVTVWRTNFAKRDQGNWYAPPPP